MPLPRLYVLPATRADVAAVFRKASGWWLASRWELGSGNLEHGAWFRGTLYPRRCDLSPDGRFLAYFALQGGRREFCGQRGVKTYLAVSRLPWLSALAARSVSGTYTRGLHFVEVAGADSLPHPDHGDATPLAERHRWSLAVTPAVQYAAERRRGWEEHPERPPRRPNDMWDDRRSVVLVRNRTRGRGRLVLVDQRLHLRAPAVEGRRPRYRFEGPKVVLELPDVVWADWDSVGRLIVATHAGHLQIRNGAAPDHVFVDHDLCGLQPDPRPSPPQACEW